MASHAKRGEQDLRRIGAGVGATGRVHGLVEAEAVFANLRVDGQSGLRCALHDHGSHGEELIVGVP